MCEGMLGEDVSLSNLSNLITIRYSILWVLHEDTSLIYFSNAHTTSYRYRSKRLTLLYLKTQLHGQTLT
ncbi:hypothetical protein AQUCO_00800007v1 [Aquilegia coerulea]|uniref:Uncharacterized protein n=1 Tax=Aquilegia coerulea TaxID=218851 RepID=A0A2G5EGR3_AQUCA|nr:hypothetical protein AQUCO_00800007v1 [Aquilegia coerulea]